MSKKKDIKEIIAWTWDSPARRIRTEHGITLYQNPQYADDTRMVYPRFKYKVTFELLDVSMKEANLD